MFYTLFSIACFKRSQMETKATKKLPPSSSDFALVTTIISIPLLHRPCRIQFLKTDRYHLHQLFAFRPRKSHTRQCNCDQTIKFIHSIGTQITFSRGHSFPHLKRRVSLFCSRDYRFLARDGRHIITACSIFLSRTALPTPILITTFEAAALQICYHTSFSMRAGRTAVR